MEGAIGLQPENVGIITSSPTSNSLWPQELLFLYGLVGKVRLRLEAIPWSLIALPLFISPEWEAAEARTLTCVYVLGECSQMFVKWAQCCYFCGCFVLNAHCYVVAFPLNEWGTYEDPHIFKTIGSNVLWSWKCCMQNVVFVSSPNLPSTRYSFKTILSWLDSMVTFLWALSSGKVVFKGQGMHLAKATIQLKGELHKAKYILPRSN